MNALLKNKNRSARNRLSTGIKEDGHHNKRFPNSASAMIRSICKSWLHAIDPIMNKDDLSPLEFIKSSKFGDSISRILARYPGCKRPPKALDKMIDKMGRGDDSDLEYYRLRAFSDFIKIPEGAFLLYMKFLSIERRIDDPVQRREALLQLAAGMRRILDSVEESLSSDQHSGHLFSRIDNCDEDGNEIWIAEVSQIVEWSRRFNEGKLDYFDQAMEVM